MKARVTHTRILARRTRVREKTPVMSGVWSEPALDHQEHTAFDGMSALFGIDLHD
jgi:hypothetical protein